jgi:hypothetical protein
VPSHFSRVSERAFDSSDGTEAVPPAKLNVTAIFWHNANFLTIDRRKHIVMLLPSCALFTKNERATALTFLEENDTCR